MKVQVNPSKVSGEITAPASKSSMQRACAAALLSKGTTTILQPGHSNDDLAAIDVITKLGAVVISNSPDKLVIRSNGVNPLSSTINCGESGLGIRMFTPLAALSETELTIEGTGSLVTRPMNFFDEIFPSLGISINSNNGRLPIVIKGPLTPADIEIDGSLSSQFLTGLLMAYAAAGASGVVIRVTNLKSKPYIDLTLDVLKKFGIDIINENYEAFRFENKAGSDGFSGFVPSAYTVEGDWSGGAFLLVSGAIAGNVKVRGLNLHSTQADRAVMTALTDSGAIISSSANSIEVTATDLRAFDFDATDCPDLFPPLVALASFCSGVSVIRGVSRLAHKESNRGLTLRDEFGKMGVRIELEGDVMRIHGVKTLTGATVHSRHDHRIAMACAVAALRADAPVVIEDAEAVNKSFPDFYERIQLLGAAAIATA